MEGNDRSAAAQRHGAAGVPDEHLELELACTCGLPGCEERFLVPSAAYRWTGGRRVVAPGHILPGALLVEHHATYDVVQLPG